MKRYAIWKKDDFFQTPDRIDMDPSVVELPLTAPVSWQFNWADKAGPYGEVINILLEDGEITGDLHIYDPAWNDQSMDDWQCRLGGYYGDVEFADENRTQVSFCRLLGVSIVFQNQMPGFPQEVADAHQG